MLCLLKMTHQQMNLHLRRMEYGVLPKTKTDRNQTVWPACSTKDWVTRELSLIGIIQCLQPLMAIAFPYRVFLSGPAVPLSLFSLNVLVK